jgi:hypothetical protein
MLALLCLTVSGAWAQNPDWVRDGDAWDATTKTLTVNSDIEEDEAYREKNDIEHVIIADGVTKIGDRAFFYSENVKSVSIPDGVTEIGEGAFFHLQELTGF